MPAPAEDFLEQLVYRINKLTTHSFNAKKKRAKCAIRRAERLRWMTRPFCLTLQKTTIIWYKTRSRPTTGTRSSAHCILSPYTTRTTTTKCSAFPCFLSNDVEHDTSFVFKLQRQTCKCIKEALPNVTYLKYFSDGCAGQYKNFKNLLNLCYQSSDFGLRAIWSFFATSHGSHHAMDSGELSRDYFYEQAFRGP